MAWYDKMRGGGRAGRKTPSRDDGGMTERYAGRARTGVMSLAKELGTPETIDALRKAARKFRNRMR